MKKIDISSSRIGDNGILYFLEKTVNAPNLRYYYQLVYINFSSVKCTDNFISEKIEKVLIETVEKNKFIIDFSL